MKPIKPIAALILLLLAGCARETPDRDLLQEIRSADKMIFASMSITKMARLENSEWYKPGKRIAVYSYDSYMQAFIDLSQLEEDDLRFDDKNKTVTVTLPPVRTEVTGRDMTLRKEYENIGLLRSDLDSKERAQIKEVANSDFNEEVRNNPEFRAQLTEAAERKARIYFENLFETYGYTADIRFRNNN